MEIEWSKAMVTRLIDMYKERRCLYDSRIQSSREQRRACIQEIASELGMTGLFVFLLQLSCNNTGVKIWQWLNVDLLVYRIFTE